MTATGQRNRGHPSLWFIQEKRQFVYYPRLFNILSVIVGVAVWVKVQIVVQSQGVDSREDTRQGKLDIPFSTS